MNVTTPLSKAQERKVVQYVEDAFMDITSAYKKRSEPSMTKLPTLSSYLYAMQSLLAFILRIPSVDSSTPLRTTFLFRFVPVILILKGNFEINLSVRFGTVANMGLVIASVAYLCIYGTRIDRPRSPDIHCSNIVRR
ncbi:hypothetical protein EDD17DRAFT_1665801 [Pisolithus thermaeus]|nr:hypothetical protein EDD17DRAFT_1665801 [Pisolithus thermaeus]